MGDLNISSGTLKYVGTSTASNTSNRPIQIVDINTSATIDASGTVPLVLSGGINPITSSTTTRTLNLAGSNTGNNTISGVIQPAAGSGVLNINKNGAGKWILSGINNQLDGSIAINGGELVVTNQIGSGFSDSLLGPLTIGSAGTFTLDGGSAYVRGFNNSSGGTFNFKSGHLQILGNTSPGGAGSMIIGTDGIGTLDCYFGDQTYGDVTLHDSNDGIGLSLSGTYTFDNLDNSAGGHVGTTNTNTNLKINTGGTFTDRVDSGLSQFRPRIQGGGGFTKQGAGTLMFDGANAHTYTGDTRIEGGTLLVTTSDMPTVPTYIAAGAELDLTSAVAGDEVGRLTGTGMVITPTSTTFAVNFSGADGDFAGSITGTGNFNKRGSGKQILSGPNTYTGPTALELNGGTLEIAPGGSIIGTSGITYNISTLAVTGGTIDTPGSIRPVSSSVNSVLSITGGLVKANAIDRTINSQYLNTFTWTGGTVRLLTATAINGSTTTAINRPFGGSLTLDDDMTLVIDDALSVTNTGVLNINGGSVLADTIVTGGNINFNSGTMRMRNDQSFDAARLAALDIDAPLGAGRNLIVDGMAAVSAPLTLAGGSFSAGTIVNPENLVLGSGTLNVTNSDLAISAATTVDSTTGMTIDVSSGGLANAGQFNATGATATFAAASTNAAAAEINAINSNLTFTGGLTNDGTLNLINSSVSGAFSNQAAANLAGLNTFTGDVSGGGNFGGSGTAVFEGSYSPGASPAEIDFGGNVSLADTNTLFIEIGGLVSGSQYDRLTIAGNAALDGLVDVSLINGFTPTPGQQFTVLTAGSINNSGLALGGALASSFSLIVDSTSVILQAIAPGLAGDYNHNGTVDAADYVVWRKGLGTTYTQADYDTWRMHFGQTAGSGAGGATLGAAVPELSTSAYLLELAASLFAVAWFRRCPRLATIVA